jgi:hypothetical protein
MLRTEVGPRVYNQGLAVATLSTQPVFDRAALVRRINISNESANDDWQVIVGQRELMRVRHLTVGNQRVFRIADSDQRPKLDFWEFCVATLGIDPAIPVPLGMTLVVQSVGGATADIDVEFKEVDPGDANAYPINHYQKNVFVLPIAWRLNASQSLPAVVQLDTQTAPPYVPALFSNTPIPVGWKIELLALFLEGMGVNTFSGAANHQSATQELRAFLDQRQIFTRVGAGIPNQGAASAAGSANTVFGQRSGMFRPFELQLPTLDGVLDTPIVLGGGETLQLLTNLVGDLTGGASYANALVVAVCRVTVPGAAFGQ